MSTLPCLRRTILGVTGHAVVVPFVSPLDDAKSSRTHIKSVHAGDIKPCGQGGRCGPRSSARRQARSNELGLCKVIYTKVR
ncbi:hypothetical protein PAXRUDRAFT_573930 [Paxillus rubicundulus Ve08.2h10]|uniref:Uncharacterized protein n=1 Tax=Paxillus rubicundulus Ve08.2h10 TaxID=930991 RepID=A0A0D0D9G2_9AGAM|nr:hypothetical protein PAXRUDRAFT_573930 [Paxillus rubicundulus Ve08.2h10]